MYKFPSEQLIDFISDSNNPKFFKVSFVMHT